MNIIKDQILTLLWWYQDVSYVGNWNPERQERREPKNIWGNKNQKFSKSGEKHKFADSINSANPKKDEYEEKHKWTHYSQTSEKR